MPSPEIPSVAPGDAFRIVVAGVGGTGVVTVGALLGMAAHIERKGVCVLDMAGLAQKGGAVLSHVQISNDSEDIHATRVPTGQADLVIGCDALVASSKEVLTRLNPLRARAVINDAATPTASFLSQPNWKFPRKQSADTLATATSGRSDVIDAAALAVAFLGDAIYANPLLLGFAWQKGCIPLKHENLIQAIRTNGVSVEKNIQAFELGRQVAAFGASRFQRPAMPDADPGTEGLEGVMERLQRHLTNFQDARYAQVFRDAVEALRAKEAVACPDNAFAITRSVAHNLAKLMSYKDEYEVARLHTSEHFLQGLRDQFEGEPGKDYQITYLLAPPALARAKPGSRPSKRKFGPWVRWAFLLLAPMKRLRGTPLDVFGYTAERKMERKLIADYLALVTELSASLTRENRDTALALAQLPQNIRGYGHVKHANVISARQQWDALLETYRLGHSRRKAA